MPATGCAALPASEGRSRDVRRQLRARMTMAAITRDSARRSRRLRRCTKLPDWEEAYPHGDRLDRNSPSNSHMGFKPGENPELYASTAASDR